MLISKTWNLGHKTATTGHKLCAQVLHSILNSTCGPPTDVLQVTKHASLHVITTSRIISVCPSVLAQAVVMPTAAPFQRPTGSVFQPATSSSIQQEVPRDRSAGTHQDGTQGATCTAVCLQAEAFPRSGSGTRQWTRRMRKAQKQNEHIATKYTNVVPDPLQFTGNYIHQLLCHLKMSDSGSAGTPPVVFVSPSLLTPRQCLGHNCFLPNHFQFIIQQSPYNRHRITKNDKWDNSAVQSRNVYSRNSHEMCIHGTQLLKNNEWDNSAVQSRNVYSRNTVVKK